MNNLLLDQTNFYWKLPHVQQILGMTEKKTFSIICTYVDQIHILD
jgi:hypothetical protein